jgi:glycosyltransferase involved in cell wall biosynthesis
VENKPPQVSVVIPAYNQAKYLESAIQSALSQTYQDFEVIVVDDGSTDNTPMVAGKFGNHIQYIRQENRGLGGARNTGIRKAQGNYIALLDSDDQWLPDFLEKLIASAKQKPEAGVFYCQAQGMDSDGNALPQLFGGSRLPPGDIYQTLLRANFLIPSTILIRSSIILKAGLFDQSLRSCEDWDLWLRILRNDPGCIFVGVSECLVRYRLHGKSLSANSDGMQKAIQTVIEKHFGIDDGQVESWSKEKRRAYGGVYRFHLITSIQRLGNWQSGSDYLGKALHADPTLALDLDLFYDLTLGDQPVGYRGTSYPVNLEDNSSHIKSLLNKVFQSTTISDQKTLFRQTYGTAYFAMGLVADNTGKRSQSRGFFLQALYHRPELFLDSRMTKGIIKSFLSRYLNGSLAK